MRGLESTKLALRLVFLAFAFCLDAGPVVAQQAASSSMCTVEGRVVKAGTAEPLRKARVTLRREGTRESIVQLTGPAGYFSLKEVEPGSYRLFVERDGYVRQEYGQRSNSRPGTVLTLAAGDRLRDLLYSLVPWAVITGRVNDEYGEPIVRIQVQAFRYAYQRGQRQLIPVGGAATNDLGEYRIFSLPPGRYFVVASRATAIFFRGEAGTPAGGRSRESESDEGYALTFYPGTNDPTRAAPIELRGGDERQGVDFRLLPTRTVQIRGKVSSPASGRAGRGTSLMLVPREAGLRGLFFRRRGFVEDTQGKFEFRGVVPGSYFLAASASEEGNLYATRVSLDVGSVDIDGINLTLAPSFDLTGRVRGEGDAQIDWRQIRLLLEPQDEGLFVSGASRSEINADGTFVLHNVPEDTYRAVLTGLPPDYYVKAVRLAGNDVLATGFTLVRGFSASSLELIISPVGGRIEGSVIADQQRFAEDVLVVLVPEPRRRGQFHLYRTTMTDEVGRFSLRGIAPGSYKLFAWDEAESTAYQDPQFLRTFEDQGSSVVVQESGSYQVELKLLRSSVTRR